MFSKGLDLNICTSWFLPPKGPRFNKRQTGLQENNILIDGG